MKRKLINLFVVTALVVCAGYAIAGDKIDVPKVITKSDAEKILGVPVSRPMLHVLKGDILITIGIRGLSADAALDSEKSMATKILANL